MKNITFITGNKRKVGEARISCDLFDIEVEQLQLDIDEIQSHDPIKITEHKARTAYALVNKPVVVNDAFWSIPALGGFPGGYMKDITDWFKPEDFLSIMAGKTDRSIVITECVIYKDETTEKLFAKEFHGEFSLQATGNGNSIEQVAVFNGFTLAEHHDLDKYSYDANEQVWYDFAQWFSAK